MKKRLILVAFFVGVALGVGGTIFVPDLIAPYLPEMIRSKGTAVGGVVVAKQKKAAWLLLTVNTPQGAILATFKKKVEEVELLVEEGDSIVLFLHAYMPFVNNPIIKQVTKGVTPMIEPADGLVSAPQPKGSLFLPPPSVGEETINIEPKKGETKKPSIGMD
jgi:hypothetical protein